MVRKDTNRHYSLRKLKTGTASVAVALTVVGAGLASQTEVKAENHPGYTAAQNGVLSELPGQAQAFSRAFLHEREKNGELRLENEGLKTDLKKKEQELESLKGDVEKLKDEVALERLKNERYEHDKKKQSEKL